MFSLGRRPAQNPNDPEIVPGFQPTPTPRDLIERSVAALDRLLAQHAGQPGKNWARIDEVLDERLALRPARPRPRPSVPVVPGGAA